MMRPPVSAATCTRLALAGVLAAGVWIAVAPRIGAAAEPAPAAVRVISPDPAVDNWALDHLDGAADGRLRAGADGAGTHIYIIDSGIRATHREFAGRLRVVGAFSGTPASGAGRGPTAPTSADVSDCETGFDGHGTHVASYAAGARFGVANAAFVHIAKVSGGPGCEGNPLAARDAVEYIMSTRPRGVINISFAWPGAPERRALVASIRRAMDAGFVVALSAACTADVAQTWLDAATETPPRAVIVAATDRRQRSVQEPYGPLDYGPALTLFAPGNQVLGASAASDSGGTPQPPLDRTRCSDSFAAPHAAGAAALYLQRHGDATPREVRDALVSGAQRGVVGGRLGAAPNRLLRIVN